MRLKMVHSAAEVDALVREIGFLPFVRCEIVGFSLEECTPRDRWFVKDVEGPWEWRETVADGGEIAYGKLFNKKAGFISPDHYPDFVNYRREGLDFDARYQRGLVPHKEKRLIDLLDSRGPMLSREMKAVFGLKGFDTAITSLQMRTYVTIQRLEYKRDAFGRPYGMGVSRYARSETAFGEAFVTSRYGDAPEHSYRRLYEHVAKLFPSASEKQIWTVLR